jgi:hypothetical protein
VSLSEKFLVAARANRDVAVLYKIVLQSATGGAAATLYASTREVQTPAGAAANVQLWENLIEEPEPISSVADLLAPSAAPASTAFRIVNRKLGYQTAGLLAARATVDYRWDSSAVVTVWLFPISLASFDDAAQVFQGVITNAEVWPSHLTVWATQDRSQTGRLLPPNDVSVATDPNAPEPAIGMVRPVAYGSLYAPDMRSPWPARTYLRDYQDAAGGKGTIAARIVDNGIGAANVKALVADHAVKSIGVDAGDVQTFLRGNGLPNPLGPLGIDLIAKGAAQASDAAWGTANIAISSVALGQGHMLVALIQTGSGAPVSVKWGTTALTQRAASADARSYVYELANVTAGTNNLTVSMTGTGNNSVAFTAYEVTGAIAAPFDVSAKAAGTSTTPSSGATAATAQAAELVLGMVGTQGDSSDAAGTWDGGFTNGQRVGNLLGTSSVPSTVSDGYKIVNAIGTQTASKSGITSRPWNCICVTYKAAAPGVTAVSAAAGSYLSLADESIVAKAHVIPIDLRVTGGFLVNTATNGRNALDVENETTWADLDATVHVGLQAILPSPSRLGAIVEAGGQTIPAVELVVGYSFSGSGNLRAYPYNPASGASPAVKQLLPPSSNPITIRVPWDAAWWNSDWQFGGFPDATHDLIDLRIDFAGGATGNAKIYFAALVVRYRPERSLVIQGFSSPNLMTLARDLQHPRSRFPSWSSAPGEVTPPTYELDTEVFATIQGYADDGSGTYTGVANSLIERPGDIIRHILQTYGLVPAAGIEAGTSVHGSFTDARAVQDAQNMKAVAHLTTRSNVGSTISSIADDCAALSYLSRFDNRWKFIVWRPGMPVDFPRTLYWNDLIADSLGAARTTETEIVNAPHVHYLTDAAVAKEVREVWITPTMSDTGSENAHARDPAREALAAASAGIGVSRYGIRARDLQAGAVRVVAAALSTLRRIFDLRYDGRVRVVFSSWSMLDLDLGHVFNFGSDLDAHVQFPGPNSDGSWVGKKFIVTETHQHLGPASTRIEVVAYHID